MGPDYKYNGGPFMKSLWTATAAFAVSLGAWQPIAAQSLDAPAARTAVDERAARVPPAVVNRDAQGRTSLRAVRISTPLAIDGQLDEQWYREVQPIDGF